MKFSELDIQPDILSALESMGYEEMTPIQEQAIPHVLGGRDILGLAETGSGKTAACGVPLVQLTDPELNAIQALILVPTRELALQYVQDLDDIAKQTEIVPFAVFGGFDMGIQKAKLRHKVHVLVATPGRLIDFLWNTDLDLTHVRAVVLDEADEMLKMGFIEDIDFILSCLVHEHRTLLFSATMPREIDRLTKTYLNDPVRVELNKDQIAPQSLSHHFLHARRNRLQVLKDYLEEEDIRQGLLFCNSRDKAADLHKELQRGVQSLEYIHGGLDQDRRTSLFNRFRSEKIKYMVATDVASRGLDFSHVTHVINYDFPFNSQIYTHRTGRAGRMGRPGVAMTLVGDRDLGNLGGLLKDNRIDPVWRGPEPDLSARSGGRSGAPGRGRGGGGGRSGGGKRAGGGNGSGSGGGSQGRGRRRGPRGRGGGAHASGGGKSDGAAQAATKQSAR